MHVAPFTCRISRFCRHFATTTAEYAASFVVDTRMRPY